MKYEQLVHEFPNLYWHHPALSRRDIITVFQINDGWYELIYDLSKKLEEIIVEQNLSVYPFQIKEKFGGFRFYLDGQVTKEMNELIREAEKDSFSICEDCGRPGFRVAVNDSWLMTLCPYCRANHESQSENDNV